MSLIFDGLRRTRDLKRNASIKICDESNIEAADRLSAIEASLLAKKYPEATAERDSLCIAIHCNPKITNDIHKKTMNIGTDDRKKFENIFGDNTPEKDNISQKFPLSRYSSGTNFSVSSGSAASVIPPSNFRKNSSESLRDSYLSNSEKIELLQKKIQRPEFIFEKREVATFDIVSSLKNAFIFALICLESILVAPYKLLKFLCGTPLRSINFCSNHAATYFERLRDFILRVGSHLKNLSLAAIQLPFCLLKKTSSFFKQQISFFYGVITSVWRKIISGLKNTKDKISTLFGVSKSAFNKIASIYLPNTWIQGVTSFLLKTFAIATSCCLVLMFAQKISPNSAMKLNEKNTLVLEADDTPRRKLKHFFRDPLVLKQEKVKNALLAMHIDAIQKYDNKQGNIVIDNKAYGLGALTSEHPKLWLEKIGKNSLYFSDKYGQQYKRAIRDMLE